MVAVNNRPRATPKSRTNNAATPARQEARSANTTAARATRRDEFMKVGDESERVLKLERRLKALGYDAGAVDGKYDAQTAAAVAAFKQDQPEIRKNNTNGNYAGRPTERSLAREVKKLNHAPERRRLRPSRQHARLDALTARRAGVANPDGTQGFGVGATGRHVKNVQARLRAAGYDPKHVNGQFDERTAGALKAFQKKAGLETTGQVDEATWKKLSKSHIYARKPASPAQRVGERSRAVLRSERLLKKLGFNPGKVDGLFDRDTQRASRRWERKHGLKDQSGAIGQAQLKKMEQEVKNKGFVKPLNARLTSISEFRVPDAEGAPARNGTRYHAGKDWFAPGGTTVRSPIAGKIVEVRPSSGNSGQVFGGTVKVQGKDGKVWVFRHVNPANVRVGQRVDAGDPLARVTNWADGPDHTHIELWRSFSGGYRYENMIDPMRYLRRFL
ncbi:MAG: peptidoglycan-binding protein [Myxococcota bacterium]